MFVSIIYSYVSMSDW